MRYKSNKIINRVVINKGRGTKRTKKRKEKCQPKEKKTLKRNRPMSMLRNRKIVQLSFKSVRKGGEIYGGKDL